MDSTANATADSTSDVALRQAELLLEYGASASATNTRGEAAVDAAVFSGDKRLIRLLLAHGGRSTLSTPDGGSLLHAAASARRADVLEIALPLLDELGIEIDGADAHGQTALHVAVAAADASLVVPLLRARATLDIAEGGGATALQMAVEAADLRCVSALVQVTGGKDRRQRPKIQHTLCTQLTQAKTKADGGRGRRFPMRLGAGAGDTGKDRPPRPKTQHTLCTQLTQAKTKADGGRGRRSPMRLGAGAGDTGKDPPKKYKYILAPS
jgi:hypothetical protein